MVTYHQGDLIKSSCNVICHQTNCMGAMGSGIAKTIRALYPDSYKALRERFEKGEAKLGEIDIVPVETENGSLRFVINMYSQREYLPRGIQHTDYEAFKSCLAMIKSFCHIKSIYKIGFPAKIGCGLAGGNWSVVKELIEEAFSEDGWDVEVWELNV